MLGILISAFLLAAILYAVAREEADYSLPKILLIVVALAACNFGLAVAIGFWAIPVMILVTIWTLHQFCYLRWGIAAIVTAIYFVAQIVLMLGLRALTS